MIIIMEREKVSMPQFQVYNKDGVEFVILFFENPEFITWHNKMYI